jgi:hypothetical protein
MAKKGNNQIRVIKINPMWIWGAVILIIIGYSFFSSTPSAPVKSEWNTI